MEGPLEVKESTTGTEEPIKSEAPVQSPDSSDRSDGAASPPPNCSICLGKLINTSFTDSCLHQFCFTCLLQWSKIKTECPLCKQTFKSIIHNVRSEEDYDQYHVPRELASQIPQSSVMATLDLDFDLEMDGRWDFGLHRFFYRTTMTGNRRHGVVLNPEQVARREQLPSTAPQVSREERRRRRANPTDYRRTVYRLGIWATSLPDVFGRFRECSADYYRREPRELTRLIPWLNRELHVLLNSNASYVAYVMRIILEALSQYDIRSSEFRDLVRPYFGVRTDHFVHELLNYARTNFDLVGYDQSVTYLPQGLSNEYVPNVVSPTYSSSSTSSDDSDVRVLDEAIDLRVNTEIPSVGPHPINMPGPSTVGQAFQLEMPYTVPDVLTISSNTSSSDDDCEIIGYVKPRHERTPEIIELVSSDPEEVTTSHTLTENPQPSTNVNYGETVQSNSTYAMRLESAMSSSESNSDSDSDYTCKRSRQYQSRRIKSSRRTTASKRRNRSIDTRSHGRNDRILSSSGESESRKRENKRSTGKRSVKKRLYSSSDSSSQEAEVKKTEDKRSRKGQYSTKGTVRVRKDLIKKEDRYTTDDTSSSDSSSESEENVKNNKSRGARKSKRKYAASSSDFDAGRNERVMRTRGKTKQTQDAAVMKDSDKKEQRYKENRQSRSRSSSESSYSSQKEKRTGRRHESQRDTSEYGSQDDSNSMNRDLSRKEHESKAKSKVKRVIESSSGSDDGHFRSSSQCSNHSSKSYVHWKRSKHKDKYKNKERKRSTSRTFNGTSKSTSSTTNSVASTSKNDVHSTSSKHSDSKNNSSSKERRKSHKSRKESKYRRSQGDTKSKSRKKRRCIRSSSSSNSE